MPFSAPSLFLQSGTYQSGWRWEGIWAGCLITVYAKSRVFYGRAGLNWVLTCQYILRTWSMAAWNICYLSLSPNFKPFFLEWKNSFTYSLALNVNLWLHVTFETVLFKGNSVISADIWLHSSARKSQHQFPYVYSDNCIFNIKLKFEVCHHLARYDIISNVTDMSGKFSSKYWAHSKSIKQFCHYCWGLF